jgi:hypothetical protein
VDLTLPLAVDVMADVSLELAPERPIEVQAEVALESEDAPQETVEETLAAPQAEVVEPQPLEPPQAQVEVAQARDLVLPEPQVELVPERPLEPPQAAVEVAPAQDVSLQAELELVEPQPIVTPQPQVEVDEARSVAAPDVEIEIVAERPLEVPQPQVEVAAPRPVAAEPVVEVAQPEVPVAREALAVAEAGEAEEQGGAETARLAEAPGTPATAVVADQQESVARGFIVTSVPEAQVEDTVEDAVEDQVEDAVEETAESAAGDAAGEALLEPYEDLRNRPIMAIIDNANPAYLNQSGLKEASTVYEMPVEGEITRLMTVYDRADPENVGPIRSARDYQHTVAEDLGGVLVHAGGSPAALNAIARGRALSYDALKLDGLFRRESRLERPYNLFSSGSQLRSTLQRSGQDGSRTLRGAVYRPAPDAPGSTFVTVSYPGGYSSGFRYLPELNLYSWQRRGDPAVDVSGESVVVQAVVVASVATQRITGDAEGRLAMSISEGEATLYLGGKRIDGRWQQRGGFHFTTLDGQTIDLAPFKTWVIMVPPWAQVAG